MALTQVMQQYQKRKEEYGDCILLFRLGDFYEMYGEDALYASKALSLVLTSRSNGNEKIPMCGMPFHAADAYISKLISYGQKVAVCEQIEGGEKNSIAKRDIVRVVTKGTALGLENLSPKRNNYLCSIALDKDKKAALAFCDLSTGEFFVRSITKNINENIQTLLFTYLPDEVISATHSLYLNDKLEVFSAKGIDCIRPYFDWAYDYGFAKDALLKHYNSLSLDAFNLEGGEQKQAVIACGSLLSYLKYTQKRDLPHIGAVKIQEDSKFMSIDFSTRKNLELSKALRDGKQKGSLLALIDNTLTCAGSRLLCNWLEMPLCDKEAIDKRLDAVGDLAVNNTLALENILAKTTDIQRAAAKIAHNSGSMEDFLSIASTFSHAQALFRACDAFSSPLLKDIKNIFQKCGAASLLFQSVLDTKECGFKEGFDKDFDTLNESYKQLCEEINKIQAQERAFFKNKNINISRNKVFGYYIELPKSLKTSAPPHYIAKQTLTDAQRYTFPRLLELENLLRQKEWEITQRKRELLLGLRENVIELLPLIQDYSYALSCADVLLAFAKNAEKYNYVRPAILNRGENLTITQGRHPLVERALGEKFVPNDCAFDKDTKIMLITGPNMAGKSTFMRQTALIVLLAHIGSFVPCERAYIPLTDKILTRIGAQDDISFNKSTFMTECSEVANILYNATKDSLVLLDEVGRSTSADDGVAIAQAVTEYLHDFIGCKTMFSTHYKELAQLYKSKDKIQNYKLEARQEQSSLHFYYKVTKGIAEKSFGIEVAKQSGMPLSVISRAAALMGE